MDRHPTKASWLGRQALVPKLTRLLTLQLLLLLDSKLRLRLESCGLRLHRWGRELLWLLLLELLLLLLLLELLLLAQFRQTLSRRSKLWPRLRESGQLRLQWSHAKCIGLLRKVLGCRQRSRRRGRNK